MQAYCFRFYFLLVTVIIFGGMVILEKTGPWKDRSDFNDALTTLNRLHQESGERQLKPVPFWKYQKWHQSSSSSTSWWQWSESWWSS